MTTSQKRVVKRLSPPTVSNSKIRLNPYFTRVNKHIVSTCLEATKSMGLEAGTPLEGSFFLQKKRPPGLNLSLRNHLVA